MASSLRICSRCKKSKDDVELRQTNELLCQACPSESLREEIPENQKEEDLKILYIMYENLVEKLKVKRKTVKGKLKIRFRWMGTFDLLKDLVTLILKKSGTWSESRRSSVSFKTSNLTITFYKNTLTLQLQGSQATKTSDFLVSLKKAEAKAKNSEIYFEESTSSPAETHGDKTDSDSDTLSVSSEETVPCHTYSHTPKGPNVTQWSELASDYYPSTPQIAEQGISTGLLLQADEKFSGIQNDLAKIRQAKHEKWLHDTSRKEKTQVRTGGSQTTRENINTGPELITRMIENTNNLLENLDIRGILSLLKNEIEKTDRLNAKIQDLKEENFYLRKDHEQNRDTIENLREENCHLKEELQSVKATHSDCADQAFLHRPILQNSHPWEKATKTFKPTLPQMPDPIPTSNAFEDLAEEVEVDAIASATPFDIQMENVWLQRQVKYLQDQVASSKPSPPSNGTNSLSSQNRKPSLTNEMHSNAPHETKERVTVSTSKQTVSIIGDSIIKNLDGNKLSNKERNVIVRSFPGATTDDIKDYCKPIAKRKHDVCIIHAGTNDLKNKDELSIVENIVEVKELIEKISPRTKTVISTLTNRYDSEELLFKVKNVNNKLKQLYPNEDLIDNDNLDQSSVNRGGLHLSRKGVIHLAYNVKQVLSNRL